MSEDTREPTMPDAPDLPSIAADELPPEMTEHTCYVMEIPKEEPMNALPPFAVGDEVEKAVRWWGPPLRGRIMAVNNDAPYGLCYTVRTDDPSRPVLHLSSLHMRRV